MLPAGGGDAAAVGAGIGAHLQLAAADCDRADPAAAFGQQLRACRAVGAGEGALGAHREALRGAAHHPRVSAQCASRPRSAAPACRPARPRTGRSAQGPSQCPRAGCSARRAARVPSRGWLSATAIARLSAARSPDASSSRVAANPHAAAHAGRAPRRPRPARRRSGPRPPSRTRTASACAGHTARLRVGAARRHLLHEVGEQVQHCAQATRPPSGRGSRHR